MKYFFVAALLISSSSLFAPNNSQPNPDITPKDRRLAIKQEEKNAFKATDDRMPTKSTIEMRRERRKTMPAKLFPEQKK